MKVYFRVVQLLELIYFNLNFIYPNIGTRSKESIYRGCRIVGEVNISEGCKIIDGVSLKTASQINIGRYTSINGPNTDLFSQFNAINVGSFCSIARNVSIQEFNHNYKSATSYPILQNIFNHKKTDDLYSNGSIEIGNDVWIATQCVILSGAKIGNGAIIAANSVVNGEIPPYSIAAGSPAKVIGYRFSPEIIEELLKQEWWNWSLDRIKANKKLFIGEMNSSKLRDIK